MSRFSARSRVFGALVFITPLVAGLGLDTAAAAQESDPQQEKRDAGFGVASNAAESLDRVLKHSFASSKLINDVYPVVKAVLKQDPFALVEALVAALGPDGPGKDISVKEAQAEIIAELREARQERLNGLANSIMMRYQEILQTAAVGEVSVDGRLENLVDDASDLWNELLEVLKNRDTSNAPYIYHLASVFNSVTSVRVAGLAMRGEPVVNIDTVYSDTIDMNELLVSGQVSSANSRYEGWLYPYVVGELDWRSRPFSTPDNHIYCIDPPGAPDAFQVQWCRAVELTCTGGELDPWGTGNNVENETINSLCRSDILLEAHARYDSDAMVYGIRQAIQQQIFAILQ